MNILAEPDKNETSIEFDKIKFMYDKTYDELNRSRDWPIKVMTFVSGFFVLLIGFINLSPANVETIRKHSYLLIIIVVVISIWTISIILRQHCQYLSYRDIQRKLQNKMRIQDITVNEANVFPNDWTTLNKSKWHTGWYGWGFYALYVFALGLITVLIVFNLQTFHS